jgi:hypothetical protein
MARWVAGCAAAVSVALIGAGLALAYVDRHLLSASLTGWDFPDVFGDVVDLALPVVGLILAWKRPGNRIGWLFLAAGLVAGLNSFSRAYGLHALVAAPGSVPAGRAAAWLSWWTWVVAFALLAFVFLLFPDGRLRTRRWRPAAWFVGGAFTLATVDVLVIATLIWSHPFSSAQGGNGPIVIVAFLLMAAALVVAVAAMVVRFARSSGEERLQLKWFAAAAVLVLVTASVSVPANSAVASALSSMALLSLFAAIAVAVLKYRLYNIDRIISRTLAYAIVTGLLIGLYAGLVLLATRVLSFRAPVAVAASTLAAAALFSPLRRRVQHVVDRRFNRTRYDADQTIAAFAARLRDTVNLDTVSTDLTGVVHTALEPAHVSVWISSATRGDVSGVASLGAPAVGRPDYEVRLSG